MDGLFSEGPWTALVYRSSRQPTNLREVLLKVPKPSGDDRRAFCSIITTKIRSLHVHFQLLHPALRTESFVFFGDDTDKLDLAKPYVLDWARPPPSADMYQHPEHQGGMPAWFHQVWALMMVLSEIVEWRPLPGGASGGGGVSQQDKAELHRKSVERMQLVTNPGWKGSRTARVFKFGFNFIDKDRHTLERYSHWRVKRFYDELCELVAPQPPR